MKYEYEIKSLGPKKWAVIYSDGKQIWEGNQLIGATKDQMLETGFLALETQYPGVRGATLKGVIEPTPTPPPVPEPPVPKPPVPNSNTQIGDYDTYREIKKNEVYEIDKKRYDEIKNKELKDSGLDVYEEYDDPQDADEIISSMETENLIELESENTDEIQGTDVGNNFVLVTQSNEKYIDKTEPPKTEKKVKLAPTPDAPATSQKVENRASEKTVPMSCQDMNESNYNTWKSLYFTLSNITYAKYKFENKTFRGVNYTKFDYSCNLKNLAFNVLDKIKAKYPNMIICSSYRNDFIRDANGKVKYSQHEIGQAADIQFTGARQQDYLPIAQWIDVNIDYDQLLLEFRGTNGTNPTNAFGVWIHVSYNSAGNRKTGSAYPHKATFLNDATYKGDVGREALLLVPNGASTVNKKGETITFIYKT